jgi:hypothetical protein
MATRKKICDLWHQPTYGRETVSAEGGNGNAIREKFLNSNLEGSEGNLLFAPVCGVK